MLKGIVKECIVKRLVTRKLSFALAAVAIVLVGIFNDPDLANGDDLDAAPVAPERMPGYQLLPGAATPAALSEADLAKLNAATEPAPTF
jgi:hypothetical protein